MKSPRNLLKLISCLLLLLCSSREPVAGAKPAETVRLVIVMAIDQARFEYLDRLRPIFSGGFKRLLDSGIQFTDAHQDHAKTSTGPGHASLTTGLFPSHSGIIGNSWFDRGRDRQMYCVEDETTQLLLRQTDTRPLPEAPSSAGRSPRNLLASAFPDWMKQADPRSKTFAVGRKDRSSILLAGKQPNAAFWFDGASGDLITSRYYLDQYPSWVRDFHGRSIPDSYFGKTWEARPVDAATLKGLAIEKVSAGFFERRFPHSFGGISLMPTSSFYSAFGSSPFMEDYLLDFVEELIEAESLGQDDAVDYLGIAFSVLDSVGHRFGPNSREVLDVWIRLDERLGHLFDSLEETIGMDRVLVALSADHGVLTLPEYSMMKKQTGGRIEAAGIACIQSTMERFEQRFGKADWLSAPLYLNYSTLGERNLRRQEIEAELARLLESCPTMAKVWTRTEIEMGTDSSDPFQVLFTHSFHPKRSGDLFVQYEKYHLASRGSGTSHGSPYEYDTHVPLLLLVPGMSARRVSRPRVRTVDLAPTLASLLGITVPHRLDGKDLSPLLQRQP